MISTSNEYCRQIADVLIRHGVTTAYCCPGSRNTPLIIALESRHELSKHVVVDERSAAFQALGASMIEQRPVVVVCTSGTAVLNFAPAVAEAYYAGVPLIVISADRPLEWIDQDDSQTIRQFHCLDHIVKGSYDIRAIPEGSERGFSDEVRWMVNRTVNEAMIKAMDGKPGPVHINVQLTNPLGEISDCDVYPERSVRLIRGNGTLAPAVLKSLADDASNARILLVAGFGTPSNALDKAVRSFSSLPNVTVMAETLSNLHQLPPDSQMIDTVLCRMSDEEKEKMHPDIVISFGGSLVSRMLKQYLRAYPPRRHWNVGHSNYFCDCFQSLTERIDVSPACFLRQLFGRIKKLEVQDAPRYGEKWHQLRSEAANAQANFLLKTPWSEFVALYKILTTYKFDNLFVSNGTCVRYSQLITHSCHAEYSNRGVSGIDGTSATAVGAANAYPGETLLLTGDMSWLYDSGASTLWNVPSSMRIIVIDNSGGGIFRFVNSTSCLPDDMLKKYFCVGNLPEVSSVAEAYGIETMEASDEGQLEEALSWLAFSSDLPRLLVVHTPPAESASILRSYFHISSNLKRQD